MVNDLKADAALCATCGTLLQRDEGEMACPVCSSIVHPRLKNSIQQTWALTIASILLYIPANFLPIMDVSIMNDTSSNTILQGVVQFYQYKMYFICAVVFVASFVVPIFKMTALVYLLVSLKRKSRLSKLQRTRLYYIIEHIGKWSMLDVYVVAIMSGLIETGYLIDITGGPGIVFFGLVVVLTMLASARFDTRLIWDYEEKDERTA
jgi:paraquat-inducible protein A